MCGGLKLGDVCGEVRGSYSRNKSAKRDEAIWRIIFRERVSPFSHYGVRRVFGLREQDKKPHKTVRQHQQKMGEKGSRGFLQGIERKPRF